jgi:hypothetical protein
MMRLTPENTALWIVNYRRTEEVTITVLGWLDSFPFETVNIIDNHGKRRVEDFPLEVQHKIRIYPNSLRPEWLTGNISECYNAAYLNTFSDRDWVLCSQDDVIVKPGWADIVNDTAYNVYFAPMGDVVHLTHFEAFKKIGFWNELFRLVGGPEQEAMIRCMRHIPEETSIYDDHFWYLRQHEVGLQDYWIRMPRTEEILDTRIEFGQLVEAECYQRFIDIYGVHMDDIFYPKDYEHIPQVKYINWYPSATKRWKEIGRIASDEYFIYDDKELSF